MNKIKLIVDGSCDLSKDILQKYDIEVVALNVQFGEESFVAGEEIDNETFYKMMSNSKELPKTSCPSPDKFIESYNCNEDNVLVLTLSSKLSGTYSSAVLAKNIFLKEYKDKNIQIVDTMNGSIGFGLLVIKTAQLIQEGKSIDEIVSIIEKIKNEVMFYGTLETLENAIKGGRVKPLAGKIINSLNFKVIIQVADGIVKPVDKARGEGNSLKKLIEYINLNVNDSKDKTLAIGHSNCKEKALKIKEMIEKQHEFKETIISEVGSVMGTYTSSGAILVSVL
ncbi:DegV family protein [Romboutsia maritimum]|uniref:DegV family protein n=1 Tax=Romboutsia maritimum TaxID=2020948 RepID=A0A371IWQ0_9FIRM|nr:DegV family protein [Romboutsia maritimum]RDY24904.1 DegV family protein [Romboutsia maritimum]